jgi:hypothetical protein
MDGMMFGDGPNSRRLYFKAVGTTPRCVNAIDEGLYDAKGYKTEIMKNDDISIDTRSMATRNVESTSTTQPRTT